MTFSTEKKNRTTQLENRFTSQLLIPDCSRKKTSCMNSSVFSLGLMAYVYLPFVSQGSVN